MRKISIKFVLLCVLAIPCGNLFAIDWSTFNTVKKDGVDVVIFKREGFLAPKALPAGMKELLETVFADPENFPGHPISPDIKKPELVGFYKDSKPYFALLFSRATDAASMLHQVSSGVFGGEGTFVIQFEGDKRFGLMFEMNLLDKFVPTLQRMKKRLDLDSGPNTGTGVNYESEGFPDPSAPGFCSKLMKELGEGTTGYKKGALKFHPDRCSKGRSPKVKEMCDELFKKMSSCYGK